MKIKKSQLQTSKNDDYFRLAVEQWFDLALATIEHKKNKQMKMKKLWKIT